MQTYITRKRFRQKGLDGNFNLPCGTVCQVSYDFIMSPDGRSICTTTYRVTAENVARWSIREYKEDKSFYKTSDEWISFDTPWYTRSAGSGGANYFRTSNASGANGYFGAAVSAGIAPVFMV